MVVPAVVEVPGTVSIMRGPSGRFVVMYTVVSVLTKEEAIEIAEKLVREHPEKQS